MTDILIYIEDDGAANICRGLASFCQQRNLRVVVLAGGPAISKFMDLGEEHVAVAANVGARKILEQYRPRLVAVGTSENRDTLALKLIEEARERDIPTVGLIDAYSNARWRWRGRSENPLQYLPDWLAVSDEATKTAYEALAVPANRIGLVGYVQADYVAQVREQLDRLGRDEVKAQVLPGEALSRRVVVYIAEQFRGIDPAISHEDHILSALEAMLEATKTLDTRPYVVARLHPKSQPADLARFVGKIDYISHGGDALPVVYSGDMVVGLTSTLLFEAALLGRPTVSYLVGTGEHEYLPSIVAGVTPVVSSVAGIRQKMAEALSGAWTPSSRQDLAKTGARQRLVNYLESRLVQ